MKSTEVTRTGKLHYHTKESYLPFNTLRVGNELYMAYRRYIYTSHFIFGDITVEYVMN